MNQTSFLVGLPAHAQALETATCQMPALTHTIAVTDVVATDATETTAASVAIAAEMTRVTGATTAVGTTVGVATRVRTADAGTAIATIVVTATMATSTIHTSRETKTKRAAKMAALKWMRTDKITFGMASSGCLAHSTKLCTIQSLTTSQARL